jgi:predicted MFS family arabinose efflux permease
MLTPSVYIVQSSFAEERQGEIAGLSRSVSNLGSCLGTAIVGITLTPERSYGLAMIALAVVGLIGLVASVFLPCLTGRRPAGAAQPAPASRDDVSLPSEFTPDGVTRRDGRKLTIGQ